MATTNTISIDWWYRVWWRGFSGRTHRLKGKVRRWNGSWIHKGGYGLPPAIAYHIVRAKKVRRVRKKER